MATTYIPKICENCSTPFLASTPQTLTCSHPCTTERRYGTFEERFWGRVWKTENCWLWLGHYNDAGYGVISYKGINTLAHRISWGIHKGPIPNGMCVLHNCDNSACINPDDLHLGDRDLNNKEREQRNPGTQAKGEQCARSKLTTEIVLAIRADSRPYSQLVVAYSMSKSAIAAIKTRATWKHV